MNIVAALAVLTAATASTTVVNGSSLGLRDPKTVVQKQKENDRALTETERRLAVSVVCLSVAGRSINYMQSLIRYPFNGAGSNHLSIFFF